MPQPAAPTAQPKDDTEHCPKVIRIDKGWTFKQWDDPKSNWRPVAQFPTNIHLDLAHHGVIADPFVGKNEDDVQWIGNTPWVYRTSFLSPAILNQRAVLAFDGLDTYASVILNSDHILKTENMFVPERVDVTKHIVQNMENVIEIIFESTYFVGRKLAEKYSTHHWGCWNGDPSRLAVRKAQYHYV